MDDEGTEGVSIAGKINMRCSRQTELVTLTKRNGIRRCDMIQDRTGVRSCDREDKETGSSVADGETARLTMRCLPVSLSLSLCPHGASRPAKPAPGQLRAGKSSFHDTDWMPVPLRGSNLNQSSGRSWVGCCPAVIGQKILHPATECRLHLIYYQ